MSSVRLTVALNSDRSQRVPVLVPASALATDASAVEAVREAVLRAARTKLRARRANRVFEPAAGGRELRGPDDWRAAVRPDALLVVSVGEEYSGAKRADHAEFRVRPNPDSKVEIIGDSATFEQAAVNQLQLAARTLPGMIAAVGLPNLHVAASPAPAVPGTEAESDTAVSGAVFASRGWIHPGLVGADIGSGAAWFMTTLARHTVEGERGRRVAERLVGLEGSWRTAEDRAAWLGDDATGEDMYDKAIGTLGGGNHFAEVQVVEQFKPDNGQDAKVRENSVMLLVHAGSQSLGSDALAKCLGNDGRMSFREDEPRATEYLAAHDKAARWAQANRELIALRFLACLEPEEPAWELGRMEEEEKEEGDEEEKEEENEEEEEEEEEQDPVVSEHDPDLKDELENHQGRDIRSPRNSRAFNRASISLRNIHRLGLPTSKEAVQRAASPLRVASARAAIRARLVADAAHNGLAQEEWTGTEASMPKKSSAARGDESSDSEGESDVGSRSGGGSRSSVSGQGAGGKVWVHRRGAVATPISPSSVTPLAGSRGAATVILSGTDTNSTARAIPPGAGRAVARSRAVAQLSSNHRGARLDALLRPKPDARGQKHRRRLSKAAIAAGATDAGTPSATADAATRFVAGAWTVCDDKSLVWEDAPEAFKDVLLVRDAVVRKGGVKDIGWCSPAVCYKVRSATGGDKLRRASIGE